jgi:uncharacterized membrane protein YqaE (UPF0057 family)
VPLPGHGCNVCVYVCMYVSHVHTYLCAHAFVSAGVSVWIRMHACVDIRVNVCLCVCMYLVREHS